MAGSTEAGQLMGGFILKRTLGMIPMLLGITFITFMMGYLMPGSPVNALTDFNPKASPEVRERLKKQFDLDKPVHVRYGKWLWKMVNLDFGVSFKDNRPVLDKIKERLPQTLLLTGTSLVVTFILSILIGIVSAIKQNTWVDRVLTVFVFLGYSVPTFWVALLLMIYFGIYLGWFPITGFRSILADELSLWGQAMDIMKHLALPLLVTSLTGLAAVSRYTRNGMLEVIRQDYIRAARAKGLSENRVIYVHALRNSLIPLITLLGMSLPALFGASIIFETIFTYPGIGRLAFEAVLSRDIELMMGIATITAFLTLLGNLIADLSYAFIDPRIRAQ